MFTEGVHALWFTPVMPPLQARSTLPLIGGWRKEENDRIDWEQRGNGGMKRKMQGDNHDRAMKTS